MKGKPTMSEWKATNEGFDDLDDSRDPDDDEGGHDTDVHVGADRHDTEPSSGALDPEDLEMLGYCSPATEVFGGIDDIRGRVFGVDFVGTYMSESLRSSDGGIVVDDCDASELLLDDGRGNPDFRSLGKASMPGGFQVLDRKALKSWSKSAPKPAFRSGVMPVKSVDLGKLMACREARDARRLKNYGDQGLAD